VEKKRYPKEINEVLFKWLNENKKNPFASESVKKDLALKTNLSLNQVKQWIEYQRRKLKKTNK